MFRDFISGLSGGVLSSISLHPFDLVRNRLAVADGNAARPKYGSQMAIVRSVVKNDGPLALWRGVTPSVIGAGLSWGLYFQIYNMITDNLRSAQNNIVPQYQYFFAGCLTGAMVLTVTNPIWVAKTQQCLQYEEGALKKARAENLVQTLSRLWSSEGMRGLYRGYLAGLVGTVHGGVQFYFLERFKLLFNVDRRDQTHFQMIALPAASKMLAAIICYPQLLVRSRMQDQHRNYNTMRKCIQFTYRNEGVRGFYKGLTTNLCRTVPASIITFYVYELMRKQHR